MPYLVPEHPDHKATKLLAEEYHAVNPTVLHETYHTSVFKLRREPEETVRVLLDYMNLALCIPVSSVTVERGLKIALKHSLGGRDALILASFLLSREVKALVTMDKSLLSLEEIRLGKKVLKIISPARL